MISQKGKKKKEVDFVKCKIYTPVNRATKKLNTSFKTVKKNFNNP